MKHLRTLYRKAKKFTILLLMAALVVFFNYSAKGFMTTSNLINMLRQISVLGIMSIGTAMLLISGGLDLSIGSQLALTGCVVASLIIRSGFPPWQAYIIGIVLAMAVSTLNGVIIIATGMPPMICTLAMMQVIEGITYNVTNASPIYGLPESVQIWGRGYLWNIPVPVIIMIIVFLIGAFILNKTYIGRYFYAVGSNPEAARLSGLPLNKVKLSAYTLNGFFIGIAGIILMSRMNSGQPSAGQGMQMDVLTACVVGGIAFAGGSGSVLSLVFGVLTMGILSNGLGVMGVTAYNTLIFKGIVLVIVVGADSIQQRRLQKEKSGIRVQKNSSSNAEKGVTS